MSAEQEQLLDFIPNQQRNSILGIEMKKPGQLGKSFWKEFLMYQIYGCDGDRELITITIDQPGKIDKSGEPDKIKFSSLREIRDLPKKRAKKHISDLIKNIRNATSVRLIEKDPEKYIRSKLNY